MEYGLIGNGLTAALVKKDSSVDWMCFPSFSSPSIFAKLLDDKIGGYLKVIPEGKYSVEQRYVKNTAVLETTFTSKYDAFKVIDFFPRYKKLLRANRLEKKNHFIRIIKPIKGKPGIRINFELKPDYARRKLRFRIEKGLLACESNGQKIFTSSNIPYRKFKAKSKIILDAPKYIAIGDNIESSKYFMSAAEKLLQSTLRYWNNWRASLITPKMHRDIIIRSAITLKLLVYEKTGAMIAAPTTSIPESLDNSGRNWDYRYCWVRDASFCADALKKIGRSYESKRLLKFFMETALNNDSIQVMYGINGETRLEEFTLDHFSGYRGQKPVRIGNAAYYQVQNDMYGEIIDMMYLYFAYYKYEKRMSSKHWRFLNYLVNQINAHWFKKDSGIWEAREYFMHYTYSKLMCYVGVDRAVKIAHHFRRKDLFNKWLPLRDEIKADILAKAYNKKVGAFTMAYGVEDLDASVLQMFYHEFLEPTEPRMVNTLSAISKKLRQGELVQRYRAKDEFGKSKSAFTLCSFWMIDSLYVTGQKKLARKLYEKMLKHANHLGLFSEDIDLVTKQQLGNFPQAYTHIALINTSILLSEWSAYRKNIRWSRLAVKNVF